MTTATILSILQSDLWSDDSMDWRIELVERIEDGGEATAEEVVTLRGMIERLASQTIPGDSSQITLKQWLASF